MNCLSRRDVGTARLVRVRGRLEAIDQGHLLREPPGSFGFALPYLRCARLCDVCDRRMSNAKLAVAGAAITESRKVSE